MSNKFKVGDRVRTIDDTCLLPLGIETEIIDIRAGEYVINFLDKDGDRQTLSYGESFFELAKPKSPVIEKTVKSIQPGVYGTFVVGAVDSMNRVHVIQNDTEMFTADQLEAAAQTFMELAAYLRDQKS